MIFHLNWNSVVIFVLICFTFGCQIVTELCTCHDSKTVVVCEKFCNDHFIVICMEERLNFRRIYFLSNVESWLGGTDQEKPNIVICYELYINHIVYSPVRETGVRWPVCGWPLATLHILKYLINESLEISVAIKLSIFISTITHTWGSMRFQLSVFVLQTPILEDAHANLLWAYVINLPVWGWAYLKKCRSSI